MTWSATRGLMPALRALGVVVVLSTFVGVIATAAATDAAPNISVVTPKGYFNGATVTVSAKANSYFATSGSQALHVVECEDAGGAKSTLPANPVFCDAFTQLRVVALSNGSFTAPFTILIAPDVDAGDPADGATHCNATHYCRLFVGQDITDFNEQHAWSSSFLVEASAGVTATPANPPRSKATSLRPLSSRGASHSPGSSSSGGLIVGVAAAALLLLVAVGLLLRRTRKAHP